MSTSWTRRQSPSSGLPLLVVGFVLGLGLLWLVQRSDETQSRSGEAGDSLLQRDADPNIPTVTPYELSRETGRPAERTDSAFSPNSGATGPRPVAPRLDLDDDEVETIGLFRKCSGSVVHIETSAEFVNRLTRSATEIPQGSGTGFVWDQEGHIVTNFHVIANADRAKVTLADQSSYPAQLVGQAAQKDLVVLKIDAPREKLRPIPLGTSSDLQVGQNVYAIGNPFGLDQTLTTGIISGLGRQIKSRTGQHIDGVVQTDAAINPGNSGGPLLDSSARLIGVNTAIYSTSGAYAGIGFAIPVDTVNHIVSQLLGRVVRPAFGIELAPSAILREYGLPGVLVLRVHPNSTAAEAGVRPTMISENEDIQLGDVIVKADETEINSAEDLFAYLDSRGVGDSTTLIVLRGVDTRTPKRVTLRGVLKARSLDAGDE
ncbi:MAG: trypsin-like peptidase domain-containing protein [Planctomycetales bacterium]|nr:trypsin-like peptidase domain-containing protein [Planctomycetales bacterium]